MQRKRMWLELPGLRISRDKIEAIGLFAIPQLNKEEQRYHFSVTLRGRPDKYASNVVTLEESITLWKYIDEFLNEPSRGPFEKEKS